MNTPSGDLYPQRVLTPKRRRSILSFRRKSDLVWFIASLVMFSSGATAFVFVFLVPARGPVPSLVAAAAPPMAALPAPSLPAMAPTGTSENLEESRRSAVPRAQHRPPVSKSPSSFVSSPASETKVTMPYFLRETMSFKTSAEPKATIVVEPVRSDGETALQLAYDLSKGTWAQCFVNLRENFSNYSRVEFYVKGEGPPNTLEFKLVDADGTNVGMSWARQTGKKAWTLVDLPLTNLTYLWGGDPTLDLSRVRQIFFAVSKKQGDRGGRGRVIIRGVRFS
jgi:hypothetical protein